MTNTDRALGSLGSGNAAVGNLFWGVRLSNQTGSTITSLTVSYSGEQWRNSAAAAQTIAFSYLIGTNLGGLLTDFQTPGVNITQLDFTSPVTGGTAGALNGNLAANRTAISFTINGLSLANNAEILLRWSDPDHSGSEFAVQVSDHDPSVVRFTFAPTAVTLDDFSATSHGGEVLLRWQTGMEVDNLGFNIYREESGERIRITPQIVAGSALIAGPGTMLTAGRSCSWWDGAGIQRQDTRYWLEEIDLNGKSTWHGPVAIKYPGGKRVSAAKQRQAILLSMLGRDNIQESPARPLETRAVLPQISGASIQPRGISAGQPAIKITVKQEGWYRLTQADLLRAGLDQRIDPRNLQMHVDGREIPITVEGGIDGKMGSLFAVEFYGVGLDTASTDARTYWLLVGSQPGQRILKAQIRPGMAGGGSFPYTVEKKDRTIYFSSLRNGEKVCRHLHSTLW
jgi:hypothetical protein